MRASWLPASRRSALSPLAPMKTSILTKNTAWMSRFITDRLQTAGRWGDLNLGPPLRPNAFLWGGGATGWLTERGYRVIDRAGLHGDWQGGATQWLTGRGYTVIDRAGLHGDWQGGTTRWLTGRGYTVIDRAGLHSDWQGGATQWLTGLSNGDVCGRKYVQSWPPSRLQKTKMATAKNRQNVSWQINEWHHHFPPCLPSVVPCNGTYEKNKLLFTDYYIIFFIIIRALSLVEDARKAQG